MGSRTGVRNPQGKEATIVAQQSREQRRAAQYFSESEIKAAARKGWTRLASEVSGIAQDKLFAKPSMQHGGKRKFLGSSTIDARQRTLKALRGMSEKAYVEHVASGAIAFLVRGWAVGENHFRKPASAPVLAHPKPAPAKASKPKAKPARKRAAKPKAESPAAPPTDTETPA